jgi:hypothetical protein
MSYKTIIVTAESNGLGGFKDMIIDKQTIGFNPADTHHCLQVSLTNLGLNGEYDVYVRPVNAPQFITYVTQATEIDGVLLSNENYRFDAVKIVTRNTGLVAPVAYLTFFMAIR